LWLGEAEGDPATLLRPADEDVLRLWPISTAVNAVRNNGPDLLAPLQTIAAPPPSDAPPGANSA
jgi:putative SOS response-associated peptidase YedK